MTDGNSSHLPSNVQTFAGPRIERHESLLARVGVHATVAGALLALAGTRLAWVAVIGMTVPWQPMGGGLATLAVVLLALACGRYLLPRRLDTTLCLGQLVVGGLGALVAIAGLAQLVQIGQLPLLGLAVGIGPGGLLSVAGFGLATAVAWLDREG